MSLKTRILPQFSWHPGFSHEPTTELPRFPQQADTKKHRREQEQADLTTSRTGWYHAQNDLHLPQKKSYVLAEVCVCSTSHPLMPL